MVEKNELSSTAAKEIFVELLTSDESPRSIAERKNLLQVSDEGFVAGIVDEVLADPASAQSVADIKEGKDKAIGKGAKCFRKPPGEPWGSSRSTGTTMAAWISTLPTCTPT
jgi:hypothetical protein